MTVFCHWIQVLLPPILKQSKSKQRLDSTFPSGLAFFQSQLSFSNWCSTSKFSLHAFCPPGTVLGDRQSAMTQDTNLYLHLVHLLEGDTNNKHSHVHNRMSTVLLDAVKEDEVMWEAGLKDQWLF